MNRTETLSLTETAYWTEIETLQEALVETLVKLMD